MSAEARLGRRWYFRRLVLLAGAGALLACEKAGFDARLSVSDVWVEAVRVGGGDTLSAGSRDSVWTFGEGPGRALEVSRRTSRGPEPSRASLAPSEAAILETMAHGLRLYPEGPLPAGEDSAPYRVSWMVELPLSDAVAMRVRIPAVYERGEARGWTGRGEAMRDFRWIAAEGERADTVTVSLDAVFEDRRGADGTGESSFTGTGTLVLRSENQEYRLEIRQRTVVSLAHAGEVLRRQERLRKALAR